MNVLDLSAGAKGVRCVMHLPENGTAMLNSDQQADVVLAVLPFAHPGFDGGPCVLVALGQPSKEVLIPLDLADARSMAKFLGEAIAQAEKLQ